MPVWLWITGSSQRFAPVVSVYENGGYGTPTISLRLSTHRVFKKYHDLFYKSKKQVTQEALIRLSSLGLAVWYMDDGYLINGQATFSTEGFNPKSQVIISRYFYSIGFLAKINTYRQYQRIMLSVKSSKELIKRITPYIHRTMRYKCV